MSRNSMRLSLLTVIVVSGIATALSFPKASAAPHVSSRVAFATLGGVNLRGYCQSLGYASVTIVGSTVYDWRCVRANGSLASIDMTSACTWMYGRYSLDIFDNFYVVTSISCIF